MAKANRNLRLVQSEETPVKEELDAIEGEILYGISLLQVLARAVGDKDAHLQVSLEIAARHFSDTRNRMELALMRIRREQRA